MRKREYRRIHRRDTEDRTKKGGRDETATKEGKEETPKTEEERER